MEILFFDHEFWNKQSCKNARTKNGLPNDMLADHALNN